MSETVGARSPTIGDARKAYTARDNGEEDVFGKFLLSLSGSIRRRLAYHIYNLDVRSNDLDNLAGEVFLRLVKYQGGFGDMDDHKSFSPFLNTVIRTTCIDFFRHQRVAEKVSVCEDIEGIATAPSGDAPEGTMLRAEMLQGIGDKLGEEYVRLAEALEREETPTEIAYALEVSPRQVSRMKRRLQEHCALSAKR